MELTAKKVSEFKIEVTKIEPKTTVIEYDIKFLREQKKAIKEQKAQFIAARDAEIAEIDLLLLHCKEKGVIEEEIKEIETTTKQPQS